MACSACSAKGAHIASHAFHFLGAVERYTYQCAEGLGMDRG